MRLGNCGRVVMSLFAATALALGGCGPAAEQGDTVNKTEESLHNYKGRDWCGECGVPESICAKCNSEVAEKLRKQGDWCEKHSIPESQCFECHPELKAKFAAEYKEKYGEDPPAT